MEENKKEFRLKNSFKNSFNKRPLLYYLLFSFLGVFIIWAMFLIFSIKITILGNENITLQVHSEYIDDGYSAKFYGLNLSKMVKVKSNLNVHEIGTYKIVYKLFFSRKSRTINIIDDISPEIKLNGKDEVNIYVNESYTEEGVKVTDNYDFDLVNDVKISSNINNKKTGKYKVTYEITDSSGNYSSIIRNVNVIDNPIEKYIKSNKYNISVGYYNLITGKTYYYNRDKKYYSASLIKVLDALYLYDKNKVTNKLKPYIKSSLIYSNNDTHHYLVNEIGKDNLRKYGLSLGAKYTLNSSDSYGDTTVDDQVAYYKKLYELVKDDKNKELKEWMISSKCNYIMFDDSAPDALSKYGRWDINFHNAGLVLDKEPYIVVILTHEGNSDYYNIIRNIAKNVYTYHLNAN